MFGMNTFDNEYIKTENPFTGFDKFITLEGVETYIVDKGKENEKAVILINGIAVSCYTWRGVLDILSNKYHVLTLDFRGTGFSEKPNGEYSINALTKQIHELMKHFNIDSTVLIGNSLGGEVALDFTIKHPEKVSELVLIDSAGYQKNKEITKLLVKMSRYKIVSRILRVITTRLLSRKIAEWALYNETVIDENMIEAYYRPMKDKEGFNAFIELVKNLSYTDFDYEKVKEIKVPTLIIWGKNDKWIPVSDAYRFHRDIKDSRLAIIENCGHGPQEEYPAEVAKIIEEFLIESGENKC